MYGFGDSADTLTVIYEADNINHALDKFRTRGLVIIPTNKGYRLLNFDRVNWVDIEPLEMESQNTQVVEENPNGTNN